MSTAQTGRLTDEEFDRYFRIFRRSMFRLEVLPIYDVPADSTRFGPYLEGKPLPPAELDEAHVEWRNILARARNEDLRAYRVHVIPKKLNPYLRYEIDWGYLSHAELGEDIMLLRTEEPKKLIPDWNGDDFWMFDDGDGGTIRCLYDEQGAWLGAELVTDQALVERYLKIRAAAVAHAMTLRQYLAEVRNS